MAENNLFQLAQVVTELPLHRHHLKIEQEERQKQQQQHQHQPASPMPNTRSNDPQQQPLLARKNACIVCAICFTCSNYYGVNCHCSETQPRRGKNLPEGGLDSRAKKLSPQDRDDYEFTLKWLDEFTHSIYRDRDHHIVGLNDLTEVSLCKAHSSTLYRAKKRHQRNMSQQQAPPSPADSNGTMMEDVHRSSSVDSYPLLPQPSPSYYSNVVAGGALAQKVREISFQQQYNSNNRQETITETPDFSMMTPSTSVKRKRTSTMSKPPSASASTPLLYSNNHHGQHPHHHHHHHQHPPPSAPPSSQQLVARPNHSFSSQLPPLHLRTPSLSSLSSTLQQQLHVTPSYNSARPMIPPTYSKVIETVSLKSSPSLNNIDEQQQAKLYEALLDIPQIRTSNFI
ncbi:hypothetical protein [Parasitella parasitica]|uniref:Uncharacterized protein n=1 Tax=Parasitella parasitica TaxID=35722 RepID=A0A0B7MVT0_9FUNG|nr:hypothetical protein [Parasitella parasitica]